MVHRLLLRTEYSVTSFENPDLEELINLDYDFDYEKFDRESVFVGSKDMTLRNIQVYSAVFFF